MSSASELEDAPRCVLAVAGGRGPVLSPMAFWSDGAHLWMTTSASAAKVARLRRDPRCAVYVPPAQEGAPGFVVRGAARVHGVDDPVGLVLHGPAISGAMTALAVRNLPTLAGYARRLASVPSRWLPQHRVVLRISCEHVGKVVLPAVGAGVAPALPSVVPPDVRRGLAGLRRVVLALGDADGLLRVAPGVWSSQTTGVAIDSPLLASVTGGAPACAVVDADAQDDPSAVVGLALHGTFTDGTLEAERVTWWRGFEAHTVDVPASSADIVLPD